LVPSAFASRSPFDFETVQSLGVIKWLAETDVGPTLGDDMVSVDRTVHDRGSHLQHQMSARRQPAHHLLDIHESDIIIDYATARRSEERVSTAITGSTAQWLLHRRSGHISLQIAQKARYLAPAAVIGSVWSAVASTVTTVAAMIQRTLDLTMPETPTDPFDRLGEASTGLTTRLRPIGPAHGRLCDMLNPHREMEPVEQV
jgi:hypothetical protein